MRAEDLNIPLDTNSCFKAQAKTCDNLSVKNYTPCLQQKLCTNQSYANTLYNLQNNNGGSYQRYIDVQRKYNDQLINFYNLGVGITFLLGFICFKYI
jgi:hypothetical protein